MSEERKVHKERYIPKSKWYHPPRPLTQEEIERGRAIMRGEYDDLSFSVTFDDSLMRKIVHDIKTGCFDNSIRLDPYSYSKIKSDIEAGVYDDWDI